MFNFFFIYSPHQRTPLHSAAEAGHVDIARYLVEQGADLNIKDEIGVSEREYTADCKLVFLVRVCFRSPDQNPLLLTELYSNFYDNLLFLLNKTKLVNTEVEQAKTTQCVVITSIVLS